MTRIANALADDNEEPPALEEFGFHHPFDSVMMVVTILKRSEYTCWPDAGGYLDQDMNWIEDILTYLALERRIRWENGEGMEPLPDDTPFLTDPEQFG